MAALLLVYFLLCTVLFTLWLPGPEAAYRFDQDFMLPLGLLGTLAAWIARRGAEGRTRWAWTFMLAAHLTLVAAFTAESLHVHLGGPVREDGPVADLLFALIPPPMLVGLLLLPSAPALARDRLKLAIDVLTLALAGGLAGWVGLVRWPQEAAAHWGVPMLTLDLDKLIQISGGLLFVLLGALVLLAPATPRNVRPARWLLLADFLFGLSVLVFETPLGQLPALQTHKLLSVSGWVLAELCFVLAALRQRQDAARRTDLLLENGALLNSVLPYGALIALYLLLFAYFSGDTRIRAWIAAACFAATLLMLARQGLVIHENVQIGSALRQRTLALEEADHRKSELLTALAHQAQHDALTGLPNRAAFTAHLEAAVSQASVTGEELTVLFVDLDGFKAVNDTLGHAAGDALLREVAVRLRGAVPQPGLVARLSGDEFTTLLPGVVGREAERVAQAVLEELARPYALGGRQASVTGSVGLSVYPADAREADVLLRHADTAMYHAKAHGKNAWRAYTPDLDAAAGIETLLRGAVGRGEFELHYQPQFDLLGRQVLALEALLRWTHPELGSVAPGRFIPVAEDTGLIAEIGAWVLDEACRQNAAWQRLGLAPVRVAVNVSPAQLAREEFVPQVEATLRRHGLAATWLELEVTERLAMREVERTVTVLRALRRLGVRVALDDFGQGHSSLSHLAHLPLDVLKVDRALISGLGRAGQADRVAQAVVALGRGLGLEVVAEGVETPAQLEAAAALGCGRAQGFLLGRPLPAAEVEPHLTSVPELT
ncbi:hypothetical protein DAETH_42820 (plasmid) [Deinococcus aetherius]|uniref:Diguanylate cyclase n=1 Tax=Deinococcus aetherius TaxID=200252 RepID=A0ABM8AKF6_9DEIO|nr:hypothetical protein DAETH_42820 [Deinococcus aetherius]